MRPTLEECAKENGMTLDFTKIIEKSQFPDDKKCYYHCVLDKKNVLTDGKIDVGKLKRFLQGTAPAEIVQKIDGCFNKSRDVQEKCEQAKQFHGCLHT